MALNFKKKSDVVVETAEEAASDTTYVWPSPTKPSALLVPTYVRENRAAVKTRRFTVLGVSAAALLTALAVAGTLLLAQSSATDAATAKTAEDTAQANVNRLAPVAAYYDGLAQRREATVGALSTDVDHAKALNQLLDAMPAGVKPLSYTTTMGTPCVGPDPFVTIESIGCVAVTGEAQNQEQIAALIAALDSTKKDSVLQGAFVGGVTGGEGATTFSLSVNLTPDALSMRYVSDDPADQAAAQAALTGDPTLEGTTP